MTDRWRPRSVRSNAQTRSTYDALHEGVPDWLRPSLIDWATDCLPEYTLPSEYRLRNALQKLERHLRFKADWESTSSARRTFSRMLWNDGEFLLDAVDFFLLNTTIQKRAQLEIMLSQGGSAWRVANRDIGDGLERRVLPETQELAAAAIAGSGNDADYLRQAWQAAFGRSPQPNEAFDFSIKAIEAALIPIVIPKDRKATLGKIIRALRGKPDKWQMRLHGNDPQRSITTFADYLDIVWTSHR